MRIINHTQIQAIQEVIAATVPKDCDDGTLEVDCIEFIGAKFELIWEAAGAKLIGLEAGSCWRRPIGAVAAGRALAGSFVRAALKQQSIL